MRNIRASYNIIVAAVMALCLGMMSHVAVASDLEELFRRLADPNEADWQRVEESILREWDLSGSASADLLLRRGQEAIEAQDLGAAIDHLTALVGHAPEFPEGYAARAAAYFSSGLYGPAMADLQQVLVLEPRHFVALTGLGIIFEEVGNHEAALAAFEAAVAINPHREDLQQAIQRLAGTSEGAAL